MKNKKPLPEEYGWHQCCGFDDEPSGWCLPEGEEKYKEALEKYMKETHLCEACIQEFPTCSAKNITFGCGLGNDNVAECDGFKKKGESNDK